MTHQEEEVASEIESFLDWLRSEHDVQLPASIDTLIKEYMA